MLHDLNISCWHWLYLSDIVNIKVGELCTKIEILKKGQFDFLFFFHGAVFHNFFATDISDREAWRSPRSQHHMFDATWGAFANVGCCVRARVVRSMWHTGPGKFAVILKASLLSLSRVKPVTWKCSHRSPLMNWMNWSKKLEKASNPEKTQTWSWKEF